LENLLRWSSLSSCSLLCANLDEYLSLRVSVKIDLIIQKLIMTVKMKYIEDIICLRVDMNFIVKCSTRYLTSERRERVRYRVEYEKIKFTSTCRHTIVCLLYKRFWRLSEDFRPLSKDFRRFSKIVPKTWRTSPDIFRTFSEECRRFPKIAKDFRGTDDVRLYNTTSEYFLSDYVAIAMAILDLSQQLVIFTCEDIYVIGRLEGPCREKMWPRSWKCCLRPQAEGSIFKP